MNESETSFVDISIVVPMLNEAGQLLDLAAHLKIFQQQGCEVLLVDGGSSDNSMALAQAEGFTVLNSARGRARQMNTGAAAAQRSYLLFLHADTRLPANAMSVINQVIGQEKYQWGRFNVVINGNSCWLKCVATMMNLRSAISGIATGDQAIFVRRSTFFCVGGFPDQPLMEDIELCKRLQKQGPCKCLTDCVTTSGRRWDERGVWRTIFLMWRLRWQYWRGKSADALAQAYR